MNQESDIIAVEPVRDEAGDEDTTQIGDTTSIVRPSSGLDQLLAQWLEHVYSGNSRSQRTIAAYRERMVDFRAWLAAEGLDLNSAAQDRIAAIARAWASHRRSGSRRAGTEVSQATFDVRLATISSFYVFIQEHQRHEGKPQSSNDAYIASFTANRHTTRSHGTTVLALAYTNPEMIQSPPNVFIGNLPGRGPAPSLQLQDASCLPSTCTVCSSPALHHPQAQKHVRILPCPCVYEQEALPGIVCR